MWCGGERGGSEACGDQWACGAGGGRRVEASLYAVELAVALGSGQCGHWAPLGPMSSSANFLVPE